MSRQILALYDSQWTGNIMRNGKIRLFTRDLLPSQLHVEEGRKENEAGGQAGMSTSLPGSPAAD